MIAVVIPGPLTMTEERAIESWCYLTFDRSITDFHVEYLPCPKTFKPLIRVRCKTEEEALMWTLKWR